MVAVSDDIRQENGTMKKQMKELIEKRIEKAKKDRNEGSLDRNEYISVTAELMAIKYEIDLMADAE